MRQIKYCMFVCLYACNKLRTSNEKEDKIHRKKIVFHKYFYEVI